MIENHNKRKMKKLMEGEVSLDEKVEKKGQDVNSTKRHNHFFYPECAPRKKDSLDIDQNALKQV